ncbi:hypothetical protein [Caulobacter sp. 17J65-9]|uniref:hypothetical protein n=1 Tax=Caulobacter sp. 17J65-9 TaxID=2709382 RepID=UPI0013C7BCFC|nr:hypothetical protein [Caulobacter sp. 17J65-9]NEX93150.1 hypothetical protein [Caulobacter sp. 17J65-9]
MTQTARTVVTGARWKAALLALIAIPMVWGVWVMDLAEMRRFGDFFAEHPGLALAAKAVGVVLFVGGGLVSAVQVFRPARLELDAEGFWYRNAFNKGLRVAWADVDAFTVWRVPSAPTATFVGINYLPGRAPRGAGLVRGFGVDGALPGSWELSTGRLVDLLNEHRLRNAA